MWIDNPVGNGRPLTYIHCTNPVYGPLEEAVGEEAGKLEMAGNIDRS
jgi:hypothetical protein